MRNASGTARPAPIAPCGLMFAAMLGAMSAIDRPTACHTDSERFSPGPWDGVAAISPPQDIIRGCSVHEMSVFWKSKKMRNIIFTCHLSPSVPTVRSPRWVPWTQEAAMTEAISARIPGAPDGPADPSGRPEPDPVSPTRVWLDPHAGWQAQLRERLLAKRIVLAAGVLDD